MTTEVVQEIERYADTLYRLHDWTPTQRTIAWNLAHLAGALDRAGVIHACAVLLSGIDGQVTALVEIAQTLGAQGDRYGL